MSQRHSEPFYISPRLFDNRRLKRRRCRWMERLRERQRVCMAQMRVQAITSKTDGRRQRRGGAALPAAVTIDLLSDDDEDEQEAAGPSAGHSRLLLIPTTALTARRPPVRLGRRQGNAAQPQTTFPIPTESILITSDDENNGHLTTSGRLVSMRTRSPPPLAPLTLSDTIEEVTVSLVPRSSTTANCQARQMRNSYLYKTMATAPPTNGEGGSSSGDTSGYLEVDVGGAITATLPDETTVHTVIANRIYELSLSKLREGLASSGVPEYSHDLLPEQLQKLSPALRAKVAPLVAPSPPTPISLKLSSDLSISLISDDDDCESSSGPQANSSGSSGNGGGGYKSELVHPVKVAAAEAHAAAKLLKQQQPQLSVVQHLQYGGGGRTVPVALALPVMAQSTSSSSAAVALPVLQLPRRRKLG
ncbi:protein a6 [Drosophila serrata]|uniref:protein a6 n=1 Tax=Drosophila serrata TaxID=7274 RepID=UPI000A1CF973|nr:protein a6 [Drosophila serrata]